VHRFRDRHRELVGHNAAGNQKLDARQASSVSAVMNNSTESSVSGQPSFGTTHAAESTKTPESIISPSILFIEVDSVSKAHAERHFPQTVELLQKHALHLTDKSSYKCGDDDLFCAVTFSESNVVGVNSIPNQIAELSGCVFRSSDSTRLVGDCFDGPSFSVDDECIRNGQFYDGATKNCESCPSGYILRDPLILCSIEESSPVKSLDHHQCCVNDVRKNVRICRADQEDVGGMQLLKRIRGDFIWCPIINTTSETSLKNNIHVTSTWAFDIAKDLGYVTFFGEEFCYDTSPYVVQNTYFPIDDQGDYFVHNIFCRLAKRWKKTMRMHEKKELWAVENDSASKPQPCVDGRSKHQFSLEYLQQIWRAYPDVPKFAYLNALAAHDYSVESVYLPLGAEAYDEHLANFLRSMMTSGLLNDTMVILRSDHGLQGGPAIIEYSTQLEHSNVWNNIIVPARFGNGIAKFEALAQNHDRMVTGFDLYHAMTRLMTRGIAIDAPVPSWSYDLLNSVIPKNRTCAEARIESAFCPCMEDRSAKFMRPRFTHEVKIGNVWAY